MTDLLETPAAIAQMAQMQADQDRFDATRPPCASWCGPECESTGHCGDAIMHQSLEMSVSSIPDRLNENPGSVWVKAWVKAWRYDGLDEPSESGVELDMSGAKSELPDRANFTADQARRLAAELLAAANHIDPVPQGEADVHAPDVKIGDLLNVAGTWLHVYAVLADEPSNNVQISVTVDPGGWSDLDDRDEHPENFTLSDTVRIRRAATAGGSR